LILHPLHPLHPLHMPIINFDIIDYLGLVASKPDVYVYDPTLIAPRASTKKMTLVFDIDETLLHASISEGHFVTADVRPHVLDFFRFLKRHHSDVEVLLWSLGSLSYAACVAHFLEQLLGEDFNGFFSHVIGSDHRLITNGNYINLRRTKPLTLLPRTNVVLVDNSPSANICNGVRSLLISDYFGEYHSPHDKSIHEMWLLLEKRIAAARAQLLSNPEDDCALTLLNDDDKMALLHTIESCHGNYHCAILSSHSYEEKERAAYHVSCHVPVLKTSVVQHPYVTTRMVDEVHVAIKKSLDAVKASADAVKASADAVKASADAVKASADAVKASADAVKASADAVKASADAVRVVATASVPEKTAVS
jgi:hypothetical protein